MNNINRIGLAAAGITLTALVALFAIYWGTARLWESFRDEEPDTPSSLTDTVTDQQVLDSDGDGLPDSYESIYNSNPYKADTDDDGTDDLAEIEAGRDPVIAAPDDEIKPATGEDVVQLATHTGRYLAQLPSDISRDEILSEARLTAYINENKGVLLPEVPVASLNVIDVGGQAAITEYLGKISASHNTDLVAVTNETIQSALTAQLQNDSGPMQGVVTSLEQNSSTLKKVSVPTEVVALHQKLVAATEALLTNAKLLQTVGTDFVAGLIASRNIDDLGVVFLEISDEVQRLEAKYGLE